MARHGAARAGGGAVASAAARVLIAAVSLRAARTVEGYFSVQVPDAMRGRWCVVVAHAPGLLRVAFELERNRFPPLWSDMDDVPPWLARWLGRGAVVFVPPDAETMRVDAPRAAADAVTARIRPIGRLLAALALGSLRPRTLVRALGDSGNVRKALAVLGTPGGPRRSYAEWVSLFDTAPATPTPDPAWPTIEAIVYASADPAAGEATKASLAAQSWGPRVGNDADYVAVLQAGEVLPRHALAVAADALLRAGRPDALFADEDRVVEGRRLDPLFKPAASHALMLSGTLTRGLWLFRRDRVSTAPHQWAETARLDSWLALRRGERTATTLHIPRVLAHRRPDTDAAPASALGKVIDAHLRAASLPATIVAPAAFPVTVSFRADAVEAAIIVPTAARATHVPRCLTAVLATTDAAFELLLVLSQATPPDAEQQRILAPVLADPRVRIVLAGAGPFNYARANNAGAAATDAAVLCLLNDDVEPLSAGWMRAMAAHFSDPRVGAVGAKLLLPDGAVQHGGVVMGLEGLAGHAQRGLARDDPGYGHRARLTQEVSAVTGACMMVRAGAYAEAGGMDGGFPIAFNDVALCLRLRELNWAIVWSVESELTHHESASRGPHGAGPGSADEPDAAQMVRERWPENCAADPFYSPNLSLAPGREWTLAFPPRDQAARDGSGFAAPARSTA